MIRPANPEDAAAMAETLSEWILDTDWMPKLHTASETLGFCEGLIQRTSVWVVDARAGFGFLARDRNEISALYLAPAIRGQGWGGLLLEQAMIGQDQLSLWTFQANSGAIRFYEREGFRVAGLTSGTGNDEKLPDAQLIWNRGFA